MIPFSDHFVVTERSGTAVNQVLIDLYAIVDNKLIRVELIFVGHL